MIKQIDEHKVTLYDLKNPKWFKYPETKPPVDKEFDCYSIECYVTVKRVDGAIFTSRASLQFELDYPADENGEAFYREEIWYCSFDCAAFRDDDVILAWTPVISTWPNAYKE